MLDASQSWVGSSIGMLALLLVAVAIAHWLYDYATQSESMKRAIPRTRPKWTLPLLYNTHQLIYRARSRYDWFVEQCAAARGKTIWVKVTSNPDFAVLSTPELFEEVLKTHFDTFEKGPAMTEALEELLGSGIFAVDGAKWIHQRKTASNLFSMRSLRESMTESVQKHALKLNQILERASQSPILQHPLDVFNLMNRFTMETFAEIGFGVELGCLDSDEDNDFQTAFDQAQRAVAQRIMCPPIYWKLQRFFNIGNERGLKDRIRAIDDTVLGIIAQSLEHRKSQRYAGISPSLSSGKKDIVSLFLDSMDNDNNGDDARQEGAFDPVFLRDIVVNFLIAGRDTTAQALSWFFYCLSQHPAVEIKIRQEIEAKLPGLSGCRTSASSLEDTQQLVYLEAALRETLRLYPSVPVNVKLANQDILLSDGTLIREGEGVVISSYVLGRMPHVWGLDAKEFKPERWIDPSTGKIVAASAFKFNAFHAGPRMCLGMNLAMMEMKIVAAMVLAKFHLELVPGQHVTYDISLTHPIRGELLMKVNPVA
ncbi:Cytochrome p450 [Globisporangium polare]